MQCWIRYIHNYYWSVSSKINWWSARLFSLDEEASFGVSMTCRESLGRTLGLPACSTLDLIQRRTPCELRDPQDTRALQAVASVSGELEVGQNESYTYCKWKWQIIVLQTYGHDPHHKLLSHKTLAIYWRKQLISLYGGNGHHWSIFNWWSTVFHVYLPVHISCRHEFYSFGTRDQNWKNNMFREYDKWISTCADFMMTRRSLSVE